MGVDLVKLDFIMIVNDDARADDYNGWFLVHGFRVKRIPASNPPFEAPGMTQGR